MTEIKRKDWRQWVMATLFIALTLGLGYWPRQSDFGEIIGLQLPFFGLFLVAYTWVKEEKQVFFFLGVGVLLRVLLVFSQPNLSDDVYRFIWDGRLWLAGINPFDHLPSYYIENGMAVPGLTADLYQELNSPGYFTIYPPIAQGTFALAVWLFPVSLAGSTLVLKVFLLACEVGSLYLLVRLLRQFEMPVKRALLYALNPLPVIEIVGNLHYEGAMIFFLLLSLWWLVREKWGFSAVAMAGAIAAKLIPLIFLPFLIRRLGWRRSLTYFAVLGLTLALLFLPLVSGVFVENFGSSLDLYFRKFEFNASIYYLLRWVGYQQVGYNLIGKLGPALALCVFTAVIVMAVLERNTSIKNLPTRWLFASVTYLLLTTTVHPWYVALPLVLCLFTPYRFPVVWSGLVFFTYVNYSYNPYWENLWVVALEYLVVGGVMIWELRRERQHWQYHLAPAVFWTEDR